LRGSMIVPSRSPSAEVSRDAKTRITANNAQLVTCTCGAWPDACTSNTIGNTMTAPMNDWTAPAVIFWMASTLIGTGASARAPIVLNSVGRGSGASAISAAISAGEGALTGAVAPGGGAFLVVIVIRGTPFRSR